MKLTTMMIIMVRVTDRVAILCHQTKKKTKKICWLRSNSLRPPLQSFGMFGVVESLKIVMISRVVTNVRLALNKMNYLGMIRFFGFGDCYRTYP